MDLLQKTKELCKLYNIHPVRSKGQNFLISEEIYDKIVEAADIKKDDVVLEVGPGLGFLTAKLALRLRSGQARERGKVVAVELDDKLAKVLKTGLKAQGVGNVEVVNQNILDFRFSILDLKKEFSAEGGSASGGKNQSRVFGTKFKNYKIVANLPYNITSVFLRKFIGEAEIKPELVVLMLQKEVAERIAAKPGKMSLLAVSVQFYAEPEIIEYVSAENFWPRPKVDSAIVKIRIKSPLPPFIKGVKSKKVLRASKRLLEPVSGVDEKDFFRLVKFGFSARRKMLKNNLAAGYHISAAEAEERLVNMGFNPKIRAENLAVEDWMRIVEIFK